MGVDFYSCSRCNDVYADCGDYVTCEEDVGGCGRDWCSDGCAELDGYRQCSCKLGKDIDHQGYAEEECDYLKWNSTYCGDCENFIIASCNYCRNEDFEYEDILNYVLKEYANNRSIEEIVEEMRNNQQEE